MSKYLDWNADKNELLKAERDISFEEVADAVINDKVLDVFEHPNRKRYPNQKVLIVEIRGYAYFVACIEDEKKIFLKTVYPSREATKKYIIKIKK